MFTSFFRWIQKYERHVSAFAMIAGFVADNFFFTRIDLWQTEAVFAVYAIVCFVSIISLHWIETRTERKGGVLPKWRLLFPIATQFALGGFWSGFVIFYGRSADFSASWPFLLFIFLIFLGSEYFSTYHTRLVFTSILYFFALYLYAIFAVPILLGSMSATIFLVSGAIATGIFFLFTVLLRIFARERFFAQVWRIRVGAGAVLVLMNVFYFTNILPPLPLSLQEGGVYHRVWHAPGEYLATRETAQSWMVQYLGSAPTVHVLPGEAIFAYSAVFAPTKLSTTIVHRWQWYDPIQKVWVLKAEVAYPIVGGRDGGYKGYSTSYVHENGQWRVTVETRDGHRVARIPFTVEQVVVTPQIETVVLK